MSRINETELSSTTTASTKRQIILSLFFNLHRCLAKNTSAIIEVEFDRPLCVELYKDFKDLGRFMLRYSGVSIAAGLITEVSSSYFYFPTFTYALCVLVRPVQVIHFVI